MSKDKKLDIARIRGKYVEPVSESASQQINGINKNLWTATRGNWTSRPMVTFTDDDGSKKVLTDLAPIYLAKNVPLTVALFNDCEILRNKSYTNELKQLQDKNDWEIVSHSYDHSYLDTLTEPQLRENFNKSLSSLRGYGFNVESLFYPYGAHNNLVKAVAAEYFRSGVRANLNSLNDFDSPDIYGLKRVGFAYTGTETLDHYKTIVDNAVANKQWLIFIHHAWVPEFNEAQKIILSQLIDYIRGLNVDIVNMKEGLNYYSPMLTTGLPNLYYSYFNVLKSGRVLSNHAIHYKSMNAHPSTDRRELFDNPITVYNVNSVDGGNVGYPGSGIVIMFKGQMVEYDFQMHIHYTTNAISTRKTQNDGSWGAWETSITKTSLATEQSVVIKNLNAYTNSQLITDYTSNKITVFDVNSSGATGFPGAGTSIVYRTPQGNGWNRNEFRKYMTNETYSRYVDGTGAWTAWVKTSVV